MAVIPRFSKIPSIRLSTPFPPSVAASGFSAKPLRGVSLWTSADVEMIESLALQGMLDLITLYDKEIE
jgi:hypothetical protein